MLNSETHNQTIIDNSLKDFLNEVLRDIMSSTQAECGSLFIFDSQCEELILDSFYNTDNIHLEGLRQSKGKGNLGKVIDIKSPVLVKDIDRDARFKKNGFSHYRTKSFISIPLFSHNGLLGLINITDKSNGQPFSEKDLDCAVAVFKYASICTDNLIRSKELKEEKEILNKQKNLLEKYASVGKLAAGVVHEINNPLDGVIRYTNMVISQLKDDSTVKEYLSEVRSGLSRIANITKSLLEFSYLVNSNSYKTKRYIDINKLIEESLVTLNGRIGNNIEVRKNYTEFLPKVIDLGLSHVITNMIKNATDAMGQERGILDISTSYKGSMVEINFKDSGAGIPEEIMGRIFEPFFTTKNIDQGTGLGLSMSKEIISKYDGDIEVQSSPGKGSNFKILISNKYLQNV